MFDNQDEISNFRLVAKVLIIGFLAFDLGVLGLGMFKGGSKVAATKLQIFTIKDSSCKDCSSLDDIVTFIRDAKVAIASQKDLDFVANKSEAQALIDKYKITKLPAMVIRGPKPTQADLAKFWEIFGDNVGGDFVMRRIQPPYLNLDTGKVSGLFKVTFLTDTACKTCYDVTLHRNAFKNVTMNITDSATVDISSAEGLALVSKYKIDKVPTILVTGELDEYEGFQQTWPQVGTKESDGTYVFRSGIPDMGTYHDLKTGKIVVGKTAAK